MRFWALETQVSALLSEPLLSSGLPGTGASPAFLENSLLGSPTPHPPLVVSGC